MVLFLVAVTEWVKLEDRCGSVGAPFTVRFFNFLSWHNNFHFKSLFLLGLTCSSYKSDLPWFKISWRNDVFCKISAFQKINSALNLIVKTNFKQQPLIWITQQKTEKNYIRLAVIKDKKVKACKVIEKSPFFPSAFSCSPWYVCDWCKNCSKKKS